MSGNPGIDQPKKCPVYQKYYTGYPALSRIDNETEICSKCGISEAMQDYYKHL